MDEQTSLDFKGGETHIFHKTIAISRNLPETNI